MRLTRDDVVKRLAAKRNLPPPEQAWLSSEPEPEEYYDHIKHGLSGHDMYGLDLSWLDFYDHNLSGSNMRNTNLSNSNLDGTRFYRTKLDNSTIIDSSVKGANFSESSLSGVDFTGSNIKAAQFSGTSLNGVILPRTDKFLPTPSGWCHIRSDTIMIGRCHEKVKVWNDFTFIPTMATQGERLPNMTESIFDWWCKNWVIVFPIVESLAEWENNECPNG